VRVRRVKPEYSATALAREVAEGFVPIVREVPGFIHYFVVADDEQRSWVSVGIFADQAGADESTERAIAFGQQGTHDWVEGDPIIIAGAIETAAP
jgi:quinol monooxygenase YgiN